MATLIICLFIATVFPYLAKMPVVYILAKTGHYDNNHPRTQQAQLTGIGARAVAAHQNSFESLLIFAIALLTALITNHHSLLIQGLAIGHLVARICYHITYLSNLATLRTSVWLISVLCSLTILALCIP